MPGAVPITATKALTNATLPYVEAIATHGLAEAVARDPALARGVNVLDGKVTYQAVAEAHDLDYAPLGRPPAVAGLTGYELSGCGFLSRCGKSCTTSQVTPAASEMTATTKTMRPISPRTESMTNLE
jgi:hypothetical protein